MSDRTGTAAATAAVLVLVMFVAVAGAGTARGADAPPGVLSCSGCHPPRAAAGSPPSLAGQAAGAIVTAMRAFRRGERAGTVMDRIAKGFSDDEVEAMAAWFENQR